MNVRDIMTSPAPSVGPTAAVSEVARLILDRGISGLPVVDERGRVVGLVTKSDLVAKHAQVHLPRYFGILGTAIPIGTRHADEELRRILAVTARDLMSDEVTTTSPDTSVEDAASLMVERDAGPLPVMEGGALVGLLDEDDIIRLLLLEEEDEGAHTAS